MDSGTRLSTGVDGLDDCLGGGLIPGTLTVVLGATGIGKTQLGMQFANRGQTQEGARGIVFDMSARIDSQNHANYARRMFDWTINSHANERFSADRFFASDRAVGDYLRVFERQGRRVTQSELGFDAWHDWQVELAAQLELTIDFFYSNFVRGSRRAVIDGIEPVDRQNQSIQFELFEYVYHQILRKESAWVARDLFRQAYREHAETIADRAYDPGDIGAVLLSTSHETILDDLIARPLVDGDALAAANTLIYMGKIRDGERFARGLLIAKHRGSVCSDEILRYTIDDQGIRLD